MLASNLGKIQKPKFFKAAIVGFVKDGLRPELPLNQE